MCWGQWSKVIVKSLQWKSNSTCFVNLFINAKIAEFSVTACKELMLHAVVLISWALD